VFHDLLNLTFHTPAKFVRHYGDGAALITHAAQAFRADVVSRQYPADAESYHLPKETRGVGYAFRPEAGFAALTKVFNHRTQSYNRGLLCEILRSLWFRFFMNLLTTIEAMHNASRAAKTAGKRVGFVPTWVRYMRASFFSSLGKSSMRCRCRFYFCEPYTIWAE
jgi:hypothetical protein